ncbi:MAG: S41 family peptidase [Lachnospiraceae bacterium]|nr:S41 family peptidase [Lachnospiraceae bacterium]
MLYSTEVQKKVDKLNSMIDFYYVNYKDSDEGLTKESRAEGMYKGLVGSLNDPYSEYYTAKEYEALKESVKGSFEGIGASISMDRVSREFTIVSFTEKSPARDAGMELGDIFYMVDGQKVDGLTLSGLVAIVRGEKGTTVHLTMLRGERREKVDIDVVRDSIESKTVSVNMLDDGIGYMIIAEFDTVTVGQFREGLETLKAAGMEKFLLDLRGNPGGSLGSVLEIADDILPACRVVYTKDSQGNEKDYNSSDKEKLEMPMVVLVDEGSASASEILAGAIKDMKWGTLVGMKTYGKGIVQNVFSLEDGSAIKLTTSRYFTPSGNNIQGIGIEPDVEVEFDMERYEKEDYDNQKEEAIRILKKMK